MGGLDLTKHPNREEVAMRTKNKASIEASIITEEQTQPRPQGDAGEARSTRRMGTGLHLDFPP